MEKEICSKIQKFRKEVLKADWKPDASYTRPGPRGMPLTIEYVSINKIKRNTAPIHAELGLDLKINMVEIADIGISNAGVRGKFTFILTDLDSCQVDETVIYSSAPTADKGEAVMMSNAIRIFYSSRFGIVDGIEFDEHDDIAEMKFALSEKSIQPAESISEPGPGPGPVSEFDSELVKQSVQQTLTPVTATKKSADKYTESNLTPIEEKACANAIRKIESLKANLKNDEYSNAYEIYENRKSTADVTALLTILRKAENGMKPAVEGM